MQWKLHSSERLHKRDVATGEVSSSELGDPTPLNQRGERHFSASVHELFSPLDLERADCTHHAVLHVLVRKFYPLFRVLACLPCFSLQERSRAPVGEVQHSTGPVRAQLYRPLRGCSQKGNNLRATALSGIKASSEALRNCCARCTIGSSRGVGS
jgi:hypothetical protein